GSNHNSRAERSILRNLKERLNKNLRNRRYVRHGADPKSSKWAATTELGWQPSSFSGHIVTSSEVKVSLLPLKLPHFSGYIDGQCPASAGNGESVRPLR